MFKLFVYILSVVLLSACGVDTSSSQTDATTSVVTEPVETDTTQDNPNYRLDVIDLNPIVDGSDNNTSDNNVTGDSTGDQIDNPVDSGPNEDQENSIFDTSGAEKDQFGCLTGDANDGYTNNSIKDSSNDYLGTNDEEEGIGVTSRYSYNADSTRTEVTLFYHDLYISRFMSAKSVVQDHYTVSIDNAWSENEKTIFYIRTPKDKNDLYGCYRYDVSSMDTDSVTITKVYRVQE